MNNPSPDIVHGPDGDLDVEAVQKVQDKLREAGVSDSIVGGLDVGVDAENRLTALLAAASHLLLHIGLSPENTLQTLEPFMNGQAASVRQEIQDLELKFSYAVTALEKEEIMRDPAIYQQMLLGNPLQMRMSAAESVAQSFLDDGYSGQRIMEHLGDLAIGFHTELAEFILQRLAGRED